VNPDGPDVLEPSPIDVRAAIAARAAAAGVPAERVSVSTHCTRCGDGDFFSHRAGSPARQMGMLGILPGVEAYGTPSLLRSPSPFGIRVGGDPGRAAVPHSAPMALIRPRPFAAAALLLLLSGRRTATRRRTRRRRVT
jgi:hypothetical protein